MCGESSMLIFPSILAQGSPPHVWGKHIGKMSHRITIRITPTCVGKASESSSAAQLM